VGTAATAKAAVAAAVAVAEMDEPRPPVDELVVPEVAMVGVTAAAAKEVAKGGRGPAERMCR
jgi:hypothetical protein